MSETVLLAIIGGVISIVLLWMQQRSAAKLAQIAASQKDLETSQDNLHKQINSRMDELLTLTREKGKAEGVAEEKEDQKEREK